MAYDIGGDSPLGGIAGIAAVTLNRFGPSRFAAMRGVAFRGQAGSAP